MSFMIMISQFSCAVALAVGFPLAAATSDGAGHDHGDQQEQALEIPQVLQQEHQRLHERLAALKQTGGAVGKAAQGVASSMAPHFKEENRIVMPVLDLLQDLAAGVEVDTARRREAIDKASELEAELEVMLEEHRTILEALDQLAQAGRDQEHAEAVAFAEQLELHAKHEEQILYPAAILVGKHLRLQQRSP